MKQSRHVIAIICLIVLLLCLSNSAALANGVSDTSQFPNGVIIVPQGTSIHIDDDSGTVTIADCPVEIAAGETFFVYLQDLPIGYTAQSVSYKGNDTIIEAEKADRSVYADLEEEGEVFLTSDMYEFIPARNVSYSVLRSSGPSYGISDPLNFQDGKLTVTVMRMNGAKVQVELSGMSLTHSFSGGDVSIVLNGNWTVSTELSTEEDSLGEVQLGEMRIYGIGKIALSIDVSNDMSLKYSLSGSFRAGFSTHDDGEGHIIKELNVGNNSVEGKGSISVALKITAGVDILVAEADLYAEIGVKTQYKTKNTYHSEWNPPKSVHCDDFKIYIFSNVGAEAKYLSASGKKKKIASADFELMGENDSPYLLDIHFEDGVLVGGCSEGMDTTSIEMNLGGITTNFGSTLISGNRDRVLETDVELPWDIETDGDYYIANGVLDLNGHTLTINGDLIQQGGTLVIGDGTLIVHGNYRIQGIEEDEFVNSSGSLNMSENAGKIFVDEDFVVQTESSRNQLDQGVITINGDFYQLNADDNHANFNPSGNMSIVFSDSNVHTLYFDDPAANTVGYLVLENNASVQSGLHVGSADVNAHTLTVSGDVVFEGTVEIEGGSVVVDGDLTQEVGSITNVDGGELEITGDFTCDGSVVMNNEADVVRIAGDCTINYVWTSDHEFTAGTMYIGGNFTQSGDGRTYSFSSEQDHTIVFNGSDTQVISFDDYGNRWTNVRFENPNIVFATGIPEFELKDDLNLLITADNFGIGNRDTGGGTWRLNGHSLGEGKINEDDPFVFDHGEIDFGGSKILVEGDMIHTGRCLTINGGELEITGDFTCDGSVVMNNEADVVRIAGDCTINYVWISDHEFTAGTVYIGGNFACEGRNFANSNNLKTVLTGTGNTTVFFAKESSHFGTLYLTQSIDKYIFSPDNCWIALIQLTEQTFGSPDLVLPNSIITIGTSAFEGIKANTIFIPDTCISIGNYAFRNASVKQIRIPAGCSIGTDAFVGCESVTIFGVIGSDAEAYCSNHDNCSFALE